MDDTTEGLARNTGGRELQEYAHVDGLTDEDLANALRQAGDLGDAAFEHEIKREMARRRAADEMEELA